ncbi:MAG: putative transcriptional regulator [Verrucomicrobiales bacterium]|jgi:predicted transcriptional regulator
MESFQIALSPEEAEGVAQVAVATGRDNGEVIREAIDDYLMRRDSVSRVNRLKAAVGIWKDREDLDLKSVRHEFDRY